MTYSSVEKSLMQNINYVVILREKHIKFILVLYMENASAKLNSFN